jgi:hypothetical protein
LSLKIYSSTARALWIGQFVPLTLGVVKLVLLNPVYDLIEFLNEIANSSIPQGVFFESHFGGFSESEKFILELIQQSTVIYGDLVANFLEDS